MTSPTVRADAYWASVFRVEPSELRRPGLHTTYVADPGAGVYVLELGDTVRVRAPESHRAELDGVIPERALDPATWHAALRKSGPVVLGPAAHYLTGARPGNSREAVRPALAEVERLAERAPADEVEESGVLEPDVLRFGVRRDGALAAVSSLSAWVGGRTDVGLLVAPEFRGRGLGRAAAMIALGFAVGDAGIARWRCREDNAASVALANRLGLTFYGRNLGIRL